MPKVATTPPYFDASGFVATQFETTEEKAQFANRLVKLIAGDFKPSLFTKKLYSDLSLSFGFIAHYDRDGFYQSQLSTLPRRINFLKTLYQGGMYAGGPGGTGDPRFTRSDVEVAFRHHPWIEGQFTRLESELAQLVEAGERADLRRLAAMYPDEIASL